MIVKLLVDGGAMKPGPAVSQKLGPLGLNLSKIIGDINDATSLFKGTKVPVNLEVDPKTKSYNIEVLSPPASELLKKELKIEKGSGDHKKMLAANASIEQIISVAKIKHSTMLERDLKSAIKSILGTCTSLGILVESKPAKEVISEIEEGKYDKEIKSQKTETSEEKLQELKSFFEDIHSKQSAQKKVEDEAKEAEKEKKASAKKEAPKKDAVAAKKPEAPKTKPKK